MGVWRSWSLDQLNEDLRGYRQASSWRYREYSSHTFNGCIQGWVLGRAGAKQVLSLTKSLQRTEVLTQGVCCRYGGEDKPGGVEDQLMTIGRKCLQGEQFGEGKVGPDTAVL